MKKSCFSERQIISILKEADAGLKVKDVCRQHGISEATYYQWKFKFGGLDYNEERPHDALNGLKPTAYREKIAA